MQLTNSVISFHRYECPWTKFKIPLFKWIPLKISANMKFGTSASKRFKVSTSVSETKNDKSVKNETGASNLLSSVAESLYTFGKIVFLPVFCWFSKSCWFFGSLFFKIWFVYIYKNTGFFSYTRWKYVVLQKLLSSLKYFGTSKCSYFEKKEKTG